MYTISNKQTINNNKQQADTRICKESIIHKEQQKTTVGYQPLNNQQLTTIKNNKQQADTLLCKEKQ